MITPSGMRREGNYFIFGFINYRKSLCNEEIDLYIGRSIWNLLLIFI